LLLLLELGMSDSSLRLYIYTNSPHSQYAMFVLGLKQVPCELIVVNGANPQKEFLDGSPFKKVPVLIDGDYSLHESRAICRYVCDKYSHDGPRLIPQDIHERGKMEQWASIEAHTWTPEMLKLLVQRVWGPKFRGMTTDETICKEQVIKLTPIMTIINTQLGKTKYLAGDELSLADIFFTPFTYHLSTISEKSSLMDPYPNIIRWWSSISQTSAWEAIVARALAGEEETKKQMAALRASQAAAANK